ncbi:hypothetical protein KAW50_08610 [candidate division WOR-3 bacterium]|nr:hypothetical protein [candidate division WOR-3 bacterium]
MYKERMFFEVFVLVSIVSLIIYGCGRKGPVEGEIARFYASGSIGYIFGVEGGVTDLHLWKTKNGDSTGVGGATVFLYGENDTIQLYDYPYYPGCYRSCRGGGTPNTLYNLYVCHTTFMGQQHIITASTTVPGSITIVSPEFGDTVSVGEDITVNWIPINGAENIKVSINSYESELLPGNTISYIIPGSEIFESGSYDLGVTAYTNCDTTKPCNINGAEGYFKGKSGILIRIIAE